MRWIAIIAAFVLFAGASARHEFYVSITEIHKKGDTLQIAIRVFTDDLEYVLNKNREEKVFLDARSDMAKSRRAVTAYLGEHFAIGVAAKELREEWIGHEYIDDVTWAYAQVILPADARIAFVRNTVLTGAFPDQQNILHFDTGERFEKLLTNGTVPEVRILLE